MPLTIIPTGQAKEKAVGQNQFQRISTASLGKLTYSMHLASKCRLTGQVVLFDACITISKNQMQQSHLLQA